MAVKDAVITIKKEQLRKNIFPQEFNCDFKDKDDKQVTLKFDLVLGIANKAPSNVSNVYTEDLNGKLKLSNSQTNNVRQLDFDQIRI